VTISASLDHPELILGPNPLLEGLAPYVQISKLPAALAREPLKEVPWRDLSPEYRIPLLQMQAQHFCPTSHSVDIAAAIQRAIRGGLVQRNPLAPAEQRRINQIAILQAGENASLRSLQPLASPASGGILAAETGFGKTTNVLRALEVAAPDQVIVHGRSEACGWCRLTQLAYLKAELPSNSSRGGLLASITGALDAVLSTDYEGQLRRCKNLDPKIILVLKLLALHRVGLLVLDEAQPGNLDHCEWQSEFVRFFLAMMNLGVPMLLCGHPQAFATICTSAQLVRRFSSIGAFYPERAMDDTATWWSKAFVPGMMRFNVCDQIEDSAAIQQASREAAGGIPGVFAIQWKEAQSIALARGGEKAVLTSKDYLAAQQSPHLQQLTKMAGWLKGTSTDTQGYTDLEPSPVVDSQTAPGESPSQKPKAKNDAQLRRKVVTEVDKLRRKAARQAAREAAKLAKDREQISKLSPEDLRAGGRTLDILAGLEKYQQDLPLPPESRTPASG
jgi:hypothetical protein